MPVINGQVQRSRFSSLKLRELSSVDNPAQPGALAVIMKRHAVAPSSDDVSFVAKYICEDDGAHTFSEVLADNKFSQEIWPYTDALTQSIRSIVGDKSLTGGDRETQINASVGEFLNAVRSISPEIAKQLSGLIRKEQDMPKSIEQLEKEVGDLTGQLTSANALVTAEKARADEAEKAKTAAELARDKMKTECDAAKAEGGELATVKAELATVKAQLVTATDEVIKVGDQEIKKSVVGDGSFALAKTLANERETAQLEKRAGDEFGHLPGTDAEKALVLKTVAGRAEDDPTRKALETILTSAEKMLKAGFGRLGTTGGQTETAKAATDAFMDKVSEVRKANPEMKESEAMEKARVANPALFEAYQNGGAEAPAN